MLICQCATSTPLAQRAVQKLAPGMLLCHVVPMAHWHATCQRHGNPWSNYQRVLTTIYSQIEVVVTTKHQHCSSKYLGLKLILVTWEYRELSNRTAYWLLNSLPMNSTPSYIFCKSEIKRRTLFHYIYALAHTCPSTLEWFKLISAKIKS